MELTKFMQKFCAAGTEPFLDEKGNKITGWKVTDFPEALQNFADRICKKQRENCHKSACEWDLSVTVESAILKAEQPKIEEL